MTAFSFSTTPTQAVILPSGGTAVVRVVRNSDPRRADNPLRLNGWMARSVFSRIAASLGMSASSAWRVEVEAPLVPTGYCSDVRSTRADADDLAGVVLESLRRTGEVLED